MGNQSGPQMTAVLPNRFGDHKRSIGMNPFENIHSHALAGDETVFQSRIVSMRSAEIDPFLKKGFREHVFKRRLRRPADLVGG
jgi:hypothetical protein